MGILTDVFISYAKQDQKLANAVCKALEEAGIRCWIAPRDVLPGVEYADAIIDGLNHTRIFLVILSQASNSSPQVAREVERAVSKNIHILTFRTDNTVLSRAMEYYLSNHHWIDASESILSKQLIDLTSTVKLLLQHYPQKTASETCLKPELDKVKETVQRIEKQVHVPPKSKEKTLDQRSKAKWIWIGLSLIFIVAAVIVLFVLGIFPREKPTSTSPAELTKGIHKLSFTVDQLWYDTGLSIKSGQNISVEASGSYNLWSGNPEYDVADPQGWGDAPCNWDVCAFTDAPTGALVAKIGDGNPVYIGKFRIFKVTTAGTLFLAINDGVNDYTDNTGKVDIQVVYWGTGDMVKPITLPSDAGWFDSEVHVEQGQTLQILAGGSFNMGGGDPEWDIPNPNGGSGICEDCILSGAYDGALVAAVYGSDPFFVGTSLETIAPSSGTLILSVNDCESCFSDNSGSYEVTIIVR